MLLSYTLAALIVPAWASYSLIDDYTEGNFANRFNFFTGNDPTNGYVNYVDYATATSSGLYSASNDQVYIGVDHNNTATGRGRNSIRIESKKSYQHGLIILDLEHMPGGACGTWPAFWLLSTSAEWPMGGEVDIIEGVNTQDHNTMAVHTNAGCSISNTGGMSGELVTSNCDVNAPNQADNQGCSVKTSNTQSFGNGFNANGGGVYATEWTSQGFSIWFFPRSAIPRDIASGNPDPSGWGLPTSRFAGACDWDEKVVNQQIIFDVTFCGSWAGNAFGSDTTCSSKASTCQAYVQQNPSAFVDTFWSINSLKVFQSSGRQATGTTTSYSVSASSTTTLSSLSSTQVLMTPTITTSFVTLTRTSQSLASMTAGFTTMTLPASTLTLPPAIISNVSPTTAATLTTTTTSTILSITSSTSAQSVSSPQPIPPPATVSSAASLPAGTPASWSNVWPSTFYTVTKPGGGWGPPGNSDSGSWGGRPGFPRPTWR